MFRPFHRDWLDARPSRRPPLFGMAVVLVFSSVSMPRVDAAESRFRIAQQGQSGPSALERIVPRDALARWRRSDPGAAQNVKAGEGPDERLARELYDLGVGDLQDGRLDSASRRFQRVIAEFPGTEAADRARRRLTALEPRPDPRSTPPPPAGGSAAPVRGVPVPAAPGRANDALSDMFVLQVGDRVFFEQGSPVLNSRAAAVLVAQAAWLKRHPGIRANIEGHADDTGSDEADRALSSARAEAVRQRLIELGVEADRLSVMALGRSRKIAICSGNECAMQNRRAVTEVFRRGS